MFAVGTQVMYGGQPATIIKVDVEDSIFPYLVERTSTGLDYWVGFDDIRTIAPVYQVTESDINAVEVTTHSDGNYQTSLLKVEPNWRTPESLRSSANLMTLQAAHYEALARYAESQVDPDEDAKAIYYEAFPTNQGYLSWDMATAQRREMARKLAEARK